MITNNPISSNPGVVAQSNDIRPIKPPLVLPEPWLWFWIIIAIIAVCIIAFLLWKRFKKQSAPPPPPPPVPPHIKARNRLQEAMLLIGQPQPFCVAVSDTVRNYLEERFNFRAPDRTTEEFLHELQSTNLLLPDQKQSLGEFLNVCDMVKFARYEPGPKELQALHDSASRLIDETEPQPEPSTANLQQTS